MKATKAIHTPELTAAFTFQKELSTLGPVNDVFNRPNQKNSMANQPLSSLPTSTTLFLRLGRLAAARAWRLDRERHPAVRQRRSDRCSRLQNALNSLPSAVRG
jgi:hypothetical protein